MSKRKEAPAGERKKSAKKSKKTKPKALPMHVTMLPNPKRFDARDSKELAAGLAFLDENGYVVMSHVADAEQLQSLVGLFWDYMEELNPKIDRKDAKTWSNEVSEQGIQVICCSELAWAIFGGYIEILWHWPITLHVGSARTAPHAGHFPSNL